MSSLKFLQQDLIKSVQNHQHRQIFSACYLRQDLYEERKSKIKSKFSEDYKRKLQKTLSSDGSKFIEAKDIINLTYLTETENDVKILYSIVENFLKDSRTKKFHENVLKQYFSMCYARLNEKAAKKLEKSGLLSPHVRIKYFSLLYELKLYSDIVKIYETGLKNEKLDDHLIYMASLCKIGDEKSFEKASDLKEKYENKEDKSFSGRIAQIYSFFAIQQKEFGIGRVSQKEW